ncbi:hypothetical protein RE476_02635 [Methanolobus mangrovi]|uniref:Uncharacterized protein n=1 Tax=Methanolobus mangrovi TaxID=3072977 RepID=A0AA51UGJ7_9EURY|nr:hypothetical protein [Methanolobus mangrovi]WMW22735.1 hypothetical protein RE476_02635 [Methanolobus mangrovi]
MKNPRTGSEYTIELKRIDNTGKVTEITTIHPDGTETTKRPQEENK